VHDFSAREIDLFTTLANQTALGIENANLAMNAMLVREMHHRIKNNLQTVAMLLRLQLQGGGEISAREALQQTVSRIMSIAAVHDALSQEGFRLIDITTLIRQTAQIGTSAMLKPGQMIRVHVEGGTVRMPSQPATTIAIVTNELIQNALEHGFAGRSEGMIRVDVREDEKRISLTVLDDGTGLPPDFDRTRSLGLQIVEALVTEDLRGEFSLLNNEDGQGTTARVQMPKQMLLASDHNV